MKKENPHTLFDSFSGWFRETRSDVQSEHVYFKAPNLTPEGGKPLILSEYGGFSHKVAEHFLATKGNWGYGSYKTREELEEGILSLLEKVEEELPKGLCAAILTQVSDVEDEINGLMTYDREVVKVDPVRMRAIARQLTSAMAAIE